MRGGVKSWICLASLAAGGCSTEPQTVEVRAIPNAAAKLRPGSGLLADAAGQLALGNVGLALEGFRKALREQPNSAEAYAGIAKCYEAMGRYDLARSNYEAALALTPRSPKLLDAVAVALDQEGEADAANLAREAAASIEAPAAPAIPQPRSESLAKVELGSSVTLRLPPAKPAEAAGAVGAQLAADFSQPQPAATVLAEAKPQPVMPAPRTDQRAAVTVEAEAAVQSTFASSASLLRALASHVEADLRLARAFGADSAAPAPATAAAAKPERGPYLERLSPGEVALVTDGRPAWRAQVVAQSRTSTTVRWVSVMNPQPRPNIRILNAAQQHGLAAQTRTVLLNRGWRRIEIGDAAARREQSVVLYPASRRTLGRSLAAQFGFPAQMQGDSEVLLVLLGRDASKTLPPRRG
jgi:tetratricopeptide (TPR) repeat protein